MSYIFDNTPRSSASAAAAAAEGGNGLPHRPATIQELAKRAEDSYVWDPSISFKDWLKTAEKARHTAQELDQFGDMENAFVYYATAATLILQDIPKHRDYYSRLDAVQRDTLILKGKAVLDRLGQLKPPLIDKQNAWENAQAKGANTGSISSQPREAISSTTSTTSSNATSNALSNSSSYAINKRPVQKVDDYDTKRRDNTPVRHTSISSQGMQIWYPDAAVVAQERRRREESQAQALRIRAEQKARAEQKTRTEQMAILQRQREAEEEAKAARQSASPIEPRNDRFVSIVMPTPTAAKSASFQSSNGRIYGGPYDAPIEPPLLPLENPLRHDEDSADAGRESDEKLYTRVARLNLGMKTPTPTQSPISPFAGPTIHPITTTSGHHSNAISYPQLLSQHMSQHQMAQGYTPSLQSIFKPKYADMPESTLLFDRPPANLYQDILPAPSQPVATQENNVNLAYTYGPRTPTTNHSQPPQPSQSSPHSAPPPPQTPRENYRPQEPAISPSNPAQPVAPRIAPASSNERRELDKNDLKAVTFPRDVLPRFLAIASANTANNRETCGLLLGKAQGEKYIVTTLLIPKQHSTSDTCSMDEEELVLEFTEKRSLITLGWIHTHPTQSCFMSSVDLHTHSGFQCMLPEAFAVVCAPQYTPNFGIFRLTDPPGLQTILDCDHTEAFHPHPDLPIYTDADKGHVQMKDMPLEIVDIR